MMGKGKYYSLSDMAILTGQPKNTAAEIIQFLTKYGFVESIGTSEPLYARSTAKLSPAQTVNILKSLADD